MPSSITDKPARRGPRPILELFVDTMMQITDNVRRPVNNRTLRDALDWNQDRYDRVKEQLIGAGTIEICPAGPGGGVIIKAGAVRNVASALSVFMSYSHKDGTVHDHLASHLRPLERAGLILPWTDRKLVAGDNFGEEISHQLDGADIVLLLISVDFLNSSYCYEKEMRLALERHSRKECRVIPIIARPCLWELSPFAGLQALPHEAKAISTWPYQDEALVDVAKGIRVAAQQMRKDQS